MQGMVHTLRCTLRRLDCEGFHCVTQSSLLIHSSPALARQGLRSQARSKAVTQPHTRSFEKRNGDDVLSFMSLNSEEIKHQQLMKPGPCEQSRGVVGRLLVYGQAPFGR